MFWPFRIVNFLIHPELEVDQPPIAHVDKYLSFVRLKWTKTLREAGNIPAAEDYGLLPCDSTRGRVHVIPQMLVWSCLPVPRSERQTLRECPNKRGRRFKCSVWTGFSDLVVEFFRLLIYWFQRRLRVAGGKWGIICARKLFVSINEQDLNGCCEELL